MKQLKVTFLGTGTSQGIPVVACHCAVCQSSNPRDNRLRCSVMVQTQGMTLVIDIGPDFRQQMLREQVNDVDAILITHEHRDHTAGLDDIRAYNFKHHKDMPVYATERVQTILRQQFDYVFTALDYPGRPRVLFQTIQKNTPFLVNGLEVQPIEVMHGKMPTLGFRIGDFSYITDAKTIEDEQLALVNGSKVLVLNALHHEEHYSHLTLEQALEVIKKVQVEQVYFIHMSHHMGLHDEVNTQLPEHVKLSYDGLVLEW